MTINEIIKQIESEVEDLFNEVKNMEAEEVKAMLLKAIESFDIQQYAQEFESNYKEIDDFSAILENPDLIIDRSGKIAQGREN